MNDKQKKEWNELELLNFKADVAKNLLDLTVDIGGNSSPIFNYKWVLENVLKINPEELG